MKALERKMMMDNQIVRIFFCNSKLFSLLKKNYKENYKTNMKILQQIMNILKETPSELEVMLDKLTIVPYQYT
jgi:hypothetical protein